MHAYNLLHGRHTTLTVSFLPFLKCPLPVAQDRRTSGRLTSRACKCSPRRNHGASITSNPGPKSRCRATLSLNYNDEHLHVASDRRSRPRGAILHPEALFLDSIHHPSDCPNTCTTITTTTTTTDGISARVVRRRSAAAGQHARLLFTVQHSRPICATAARTRHHAPAVSTTSSHCAQHRQHL